MSVFLAARKTEGREEEILDQLEKVSSKLDLLEDSITHRIKQNVVLPMVTESRFQDWGDWYLAERCGTTEARHAEWKQFPAKEVDELATDVKRMREERLQKELSSRVSKMEDDICALKRELQLTLHNLGNLFTFVYGRDRGKSIQLKGGIQGDHLVIHTIRGPREWFDFVGIVFQKYFWKTFQVLQFMLKVVVCWAFVFVDVQEVVFVFGGHVVFGSQVFNVVVLIQECVFLVFVSEIKANDACCIDSHAKWEVFEFLADKDDGHFVVASLIENRLPRLPLMASDEVIISSSTNSAPPCLDANAKMFSTSFSFHRRDAFLAGPCFARWDQCGLWVRRGNILLVELCVSEIRPSDEIFDEIALSWIGRAEDEQSKAFLWIRKEWIRQRMTDASCWWRLMMPSFDDILLYDVGEKIFFPP
jgi:hypothetical protein